MMKKRSKIQKHLAKMVLAALLCTGGAHGLISPSVAEAAFAPVSGGGSPSPYTITGTVEKGGVTKIFTVFFITVPVEFSPLPNT